MKKKIKILSALSLTMLLLFSSCEKDLYDEAIQTERNIKISRVSIKDPAVFNNRNLMFEIQKVKEKQTLEQASSRIVYDSINNFYFDDENGLKIESGEYESYTFKIYRDIENNDLENIIFTSKTNGEFDSKIIKYSLNEEQKENILNNENVDLSNVSTQISSLSKVLYIPCFEFIHHPAQINSAGGVEFSYIEVVEVDCPDEGGGGVGGVRRAHGGGCGPGARACVRGRGVLAGAARCLRPSALRPARTRGRARSAR